MIKMGNSYIDESKICVLSEIQHSEYTDLIWCYVNGAKVVDTKDNIKDFVDKWHELLKNFSNI